MQVDLRQIDRLRDDEGMRHRDRGVIPHAHHGPPKGIVRCPEPVPQKASRSPYSALLRAGSLASGWTGLSTETPISIRSGMTGI